MFGEQSEFGDLEQVLGGFGQQAEAVDEFDFEFVQFGGGFGAGDAFVQDQAQVYVVDVVVRDHGRDAEVDFDAGVERGIRVGDFAGLERVDGFLQDFGVQAEADFRDLAALVFAEQFAGAADLEIVCGQGEADAEVLE